MTRYVDFQKIKQRVPIEAIVAHYKLSLEEQKNGQLVGDCPFCGDSDEDAERFKVTPDKNAWKCWACEESGNSLDLVALLEETSLPKAAIHIVEAFEITDCELEKRTKRKKKKKTNGKAKGKGDAKREPKSSQEEPQAADEPEPDSEEEDELALEDETELRHNPPLTWEGLKNLDSTNESLSELSLWLPEIAPEFEAGLCSRGMMAGRFAVPIHNTEGELLAYCGIAVDESKERLKFPPSDKYDPSIDLFNLHRAIEDPLYIEHGQLVIVEDITEAMQVWDKDNKNVVATMQGVPTAQQILRLKSLDTPRKSFSVMWRQQSTELDRALSMLAEFAWVRVRYAE